MKKYDVTIGFGELKIWDYGYFEKTGSLVIPFDSNDYLFVIACENHYRFRKDDFSRYETLIKREFKRISKLKNRR